MTDYYKILGITESSSQEEVKRAYKKLSLKFHPDKNDGDLFFENMFKQILEAYEILGNVEKRRNYDLNYNKENPKSNSSNKWESPINNFIPVIEIFKSNKIYFYSGDVINFEWKTYNADKISIKPFGVVNASDSKSFRLNNINQETLIITLEATNSNIGKTTTYTIELKNKLFSDHSFKDPKQKNELFTKSLYSEFFEVHGRLKRKDYLIRTCLLVSVAFLFNIFMNDGINGSGVNALRGLFLIITSLIFLIQAIKRSHDLNLSGAYCFLFIIPVLNIIYFIYLLVKPGNNELNRYN